MNTTEVKTKRTKRGRPNPNYQTCAHCNQGFARLVKLPQVYQRGKQLTVIENVPMMLCDNCGQSYVTSDTWKGIDEVLAHPAKFTKNNLFQLHLLRDAWLINHSQRSHLFVFLQDENPYQA